MHVVSSEESSDLLQGEDSAQIISHEIVLRADMQDYWVKLVQDNKIEKLSQESSHGGICRFLVDTGQANCSVVNKQFNCIARPRGAPQFDGHQEDPVFLQMDWVSPHPVR